jgi:peptidoglycan hydrolase-like protein with peptidoglycan-binding domain
LSRTRGWLALLTGAVVAVSLVSVPGTAHADVWGPVTYDPHDALWDEGTHDVLGYGGVRAANIVGFWQAFLRSYNLVDCTGVDGYWGPQTDQGTRNIQRFFGLPDDGVVGSRTWNAASHWVDYVGTENGQRKYTPMFSDSVDPATYYQNIGDPFRGYWFWNTNSAYSWVTPINSAAGGDIQFIGIDCD